LNQEFYHRLISGREKGAGAGIARFFLAGVSKCYSAIIRLRNSAYSKGVFKSYKSDAVVLSVGNITVGGTGKTPFVIWLASFLCELGMEIAILTRGYKSSISAQEHKSIRTDEVEILKTSCPDAGVIVNPDRLAGAKEAVKQGANVLILDDGFQHRRLARDLDIVVIDATCPFGFDRLLPVGLLREPVDSLRRTDAVVITRTDQAKPGTLEQIVEKIKQIKPDMLLAESIHQPIGIKTANLKQISAEQIKGKKVYAFCGIGNPDAFFDTIKQLSAELSGSQIFNDHHHYRENDINQIRRQADSTKSDFILTTQKDWTKISALSISQDFNFAGPVPLGYLAVELKITRGEDKLKQLIKEALKSKILGD